MPITSAVPDRAPAMGSILFSGPELVEPYGLARNDDVLWVADPDRDRGTGTLRAYDLVSGEEIAARRFTISFPTGVALWEDGVLVVDHGRGDSVSLYGPEGERATGQGGMNDPKDVAADRARDRIYVADRGNRRVVVMTGNLEVVAAWSPPNDEFGPNGLAVGNNGHLFVADRDGPAVWVFDTEGAVVGKMGSSGSKEEGGLGMPGGVATDPWGRLYVADYSRDVIQVYSQTGDFVGTLGADDAGDPSFGRPRGLFYDRIDGRLLVAGGDSLRGIARVWSVPVSSR